MYVSVTAD
ncbi:hypothetical protein ECFRIK1999_1414, partial [Escherichia coli FRIK1999]